VSGARRPGHLAVLTRAHARRHLAATPRWLLLAALPLAAAAQAPLPGATAPAPSARSTGPPGKSQPRPAGPGAQGPSSQPAPARKPGPPTARDGKPGSSDGGTRSPLATPENPVFVACDKGRMEGNEQRFVCTGHVKMVRNSTTLTCDRSIGHYLGKDASQITRLECFGNVEAVDGERWARGDHADYDTVKEVLVLTGNPEARQGSNTMKGDRVVFYVDTDLIEVERVTGVLESKGKEPGRRPDAGKP